MTLFGVPNELVGTRIGITVTKKVGGAVLRNRIKRRFREIFRHHRQELLPPMDVVVNAHYGIEAVAYAELEREFVEQAHALARRLAR
jgi:ribonuclease P protein component